MSGVEFLACAGVSALAVKARRTWLALALLALAAFAAFHGVHP